MKSACSRRVRFIAVIASFAIWVGSSLACAQNSEGERVFAESKGAVEKAWKTMQSTTSGRLPTLEGFAKPGEHPLDRYERGYFQASLQITPLPSGGSRVQISVKVTAWYNDPSGVRPAYQLLRSNGRIEADILDQLAQQVAGSTERPTVQPLSEPQVASTSAVESAPTGSEPAVPEAPDVKRDFPSPSVSSGISHAQLDKSTTTGDPTSSESALRAEAQSLEEALKNQAHPKNLVAVRKLGTAVVPSPSLTAKPLFLASLHDEFEMLDFNQDWVHVRISGLSRGWIWRNNVEMPEGIADTAVATPARSVASDLFHVVREETAPFPGTWEPLRGRKVKIISVEKIDENAKDAGSKERLEYTKFLLDKNFAEVAARPQDLAGIVVIFDSADGGMIAASFDTLKDWKAGTLSDSALWHKCLFDPPETFDSSGNTGTR